MQLTYRATSVKCKSVCLELTYAGEAKEPGVGSLDSMKGETALKIRRNRQRVRRRVLMIIRGIGVRPSSRVDESLSRTGFKDVAVGPFARLAEELFTRVNQ